MAVQTHEYTVNLKWTGNQKGGTTSYQAYDRDHEISMPGKVTIPGSSDPAFRGDRSRYNPEELLVAAISACHMLWYLHLCADSGVEVTEYVDVPLGRMIESSGSGGHFTDVLLRPKVTIARETSKKDAEALHSQAHERCYIANSLNFPVRCQPRILTAG